MYCVKITWYPVNAGVTHLKDLIADTAAAIMYEQIAFVSYARARACFVLAAALSPYRAKSLRAVYALLVQHSAANLLSLLLCYFSIPAPGIECARDEIRESV